VIDGDALPIEPAAEAWFERSGCDAVVESVSRGDDYELLCAVQPRHRRRLAAASRHGDAPLRRIGVCTAEREVIITRTVDGTRRSAPLTGGYQHFR
jgi:thiamine monophosphate kinase